MANEITEYVNTAIDSLKRFNLNNIQSPISFLNDEDLLNLQSPLSFQEWLKYHTSIVSDNEYKEYNSYLRKWYAQKASKREEQVEKIRNDYVAFLRELSLVFKDDPQFKYISQIDFDDNISIEYAIPFFTKKVKEICFYLINKRESAKQAKLKYNMVGSTQAIEKLFYQYLLQAFTKKNSLITVPEFSYFTDLPELSAINGSFKISVEELNDDTSYFDKDPTLEIKPTRQLKDYLKEKGLQTNNYDWVLNSGVFSTFSDNPFFWTLQSLLNKYGVEHESQLPLSSVDLSDQINPQTNEVNLSLLTNKYIGNDVFVLSGGYYIANTKDFEFDISEKNNWIYWPYGEYFTEAYDESIFDSIKINETSLVESGATPSEDYRKADKIFVQKGDEIQGAWLRYYLKQTETQVMSCALTEDQTTEFKFPYCNYGSIGDGTEWVGRDISNLEMEYVTLDDDNKKIVDKAYWSYTDTASQICAIPINETSLIDDGAFAASYYVSADKITKRTATNPNKFNDLNPDGVYKDGFEYAWLYRFNKTDIPIKTGKSTIQWPIQRIENVDEPVLNLVPETCAPIALSSISIDNFLGSRAGYDIHDSDILYKLNGKDGYPVECAYLVGVPISESLPSDVFVTGAANKTFISNVTGIMQIGLTVKCKPDTPETFIWQDESTNISKLELTYKPHQDDCPFALYSEHPSVYNQKDALEFEFNYPWKECTCKSIMYSPIGHPGETYDDYNRMADIVFLDTQDPLPFDITTWKGSDGLDYKHSKDFAWYRITKTETSNQQGLDVDVGAGIGEWVTGSGDEFKFIRGKQYKYIRTGMRRSYDELIAESVPPMIISRLYKHRNKPTWKKAILTTNGDWKATSDDSDMLLKAGDYLVYDHYQSNFYCLKYNGTYKEYYVSKYSTSAVNPQNNPWVNFTFATTGTAIKYQWPSFIKIGEEAGVVPNFYAQDLSAIRWTVNMGASSYSVNMSPEDQLTVICDTPTTIYTEATGFVINGEPETIKMPKVVISPPVYTQTKETSGEHFIQTIYSDTLNFMLNVPLSGWNYETHSYDVTSSGIRPFWAVAVDDDSLITKNKGVREWGYGLRVADEYTLIHQPEVSFLTLEAEIPIKYEKSLGSIIWKQPIDFIVNDETKEWCSLEIDANKTSPLSSYLYNQNKELVVYPTTQRSNLTLDYGDFVNYWAQDDFTWSQTLTDSRGGVPPYGGTYVPFASSLVIKADVPYANLSNRHYPTIAVYPNISNLYTDRDTGGYFNYKGLGALTYLGKNYYNVINPTLSSENVKPEDLLFRAPEIYVSNDIGLTNKVQNGPMRMGENDSSWMKAKTSESGKAGKIIGEENYKEFTAYQTKNETIGRNVVGLIDTDYHLDPWYSKFDNDWRDIVSWPANFRGQFPIDKWYDSIDLFLKNETKQRIQRSIKLEPPYYNPDGESRNIVFRKFDNLSVIGSNSQQERHAFNEVVIFNTPELSVDAVGGLVVQVNSDRYKNVFLPIYTRDDISGIRVGLDAMIYGERVDEYSALSYGMLEIEVNGENYFTPLYRMRKTVCETTNLVGRHLVTGEYDHKGYMLVYINEIEKGLLSLYKIKEVK